MCAFLSLFDPKREGAWEEAVPVVSSSPQASPSRVGGARRSKAATFYCGFVAPASRASDLLASAASGADGDSCNNAVYSSFAS